MTEPSFRVGVLASGTGTNLKAILESVHGSDGIAVVAAASNKADAPALAIASQAGIKTASFSSEQSKDREQRDLAIADFLDQAGVELVVLAGYMELVSEAFLQRFSNRVINVHPALLPAFQGLHAVERQLEYGVKIGGVTVHFVDQGIDTGAVIMQQAVELPESRDLDETLEVLHAVEHRLLPETIRLIASGAVQFDSYNPRLVRVRAL